jgi:hypothetical protein
MNEKEYKEAIVKLLDGIHSEIFLNRIYSLVSHYFNK